MNGVTRTTVFAVVASTAVQLTGCDFSVSTPDTPQTIADRRGGIETDFVITVDSVQLPPTEAHFGELSHAIRGFGGYHSDRDGQETQRLRVLLTILLRHVGQRRCFGTSLTEQKP